MVPIEFIIIPVFGTLVAAGVWWEHSRANKIVRQWARTSDVELVSAEKRYLRTGPFPLPARGQFVFRVIVRDHAGVERGGWLRVGSWWAGLMSNKTKIVWDP